MVAGGKIKVLCKSYESFLKRDIERVVVDLVDTPLANGALRETESANSQQIS